MAQFCVRGQRLGGHAQTALLEFSAIEWWWTGVFGEHTKSAVVHFRTVAG